MNLVDYGTAPAYSGNRTFGYDEPTDIFSTAKSGAAWEPENFLPTLETDFDTVGATDALTLINSRMVAAGQGSLHTYWLGVKGCLRVGRLNGPSFLHGPCAC